MAGRRKIGPMPPTDPSLPETSARQCPSCQSEKIAHAGHVIAGKGMVKSEQRCEACGAAFWLVRERIPLSGALGARIGEDSEEDQANPTP